MGFLVRATRFYLLLLIACRLVELSQGAAVGQYLPTSNALLLLLAALAVKTALECRPIPAAQHLPDAAPREARRRTQA